MKTKIYEPFDATRLNAVSGMIWKMFTARGCGKAADAECKVRRKQFAMNSVNMQLQHQIDNMLKNVV